MFGSFNADFRPTSCSCRTLLLAAAVASVFGFQGSALADTLADAILTAEAGGIVTLPPGPTLGRADVTDTLTIRGVEGSILSAPQDDAVLVALPGTDLHLSNVAVLQEGQSKYAIYVDGGNVHLQDCRIEGPFEVSVYVASGSLSIVNCDIDGGLYGIQAAPGATVTVASMSMTGQGDTAIRVDGAALDLTDVTIENGGRNGVIVIGSPAFHADGLTLSGILSTGLWVEDTSVASLRRTVIEVSGQALTLSGGVDFRIEGFQLQGTGGALVAEGSGGEVALTRGRMQSGEGAVTAYLRDLSSLRIDDVEIIGGDTGLYLSGALPDTTLDRTLVHSQTTTGLFIDAITPQDAPLAVSRLKVIGSGTALPAYFRESGPVDFFQSGLIAQGALPFAVEGASAPLFKDSALFSAPDPIEGHLVFDAAPGDPLNFVPFGSLWWAGDAAIVPGTVVMTLAGLAESLPIDNGLQHAVVELGTGADHRPKVIALALEAALPLATNAPIEAELATVGLAPPEDGWVWDAGAVTIALTGRNGMPTTASPGDFPITLPVGDYSLSLDGRPAGRVQISKDGDLEMPLPDAPFFAWRSAEGAKVRGPALYLRPKEELAELVAGLRPLRPGDSWGFGPVFAARRDADRALAARVIDKAQADLPSVLTEMAELRATERWAEFNLRWQQVDMLFDVLAQFGSPEDAALLLALEVPAGLQIDHLETAVLIEMRLGLLRKGATLTAARNHLAAFLAGDDPAGPPALRLLRALARSGLTDAAPLLADLNRSMNPAGETDPPSALGIIELARFGPELAGDLPTLYLDQFARHLFAHLDGARPPDEPLPRGTDFWNAAATALALEAIAASPGSGTRRLPIPVDASIGPSAWLFADPEILIRGPLGIVGPPDVQRLSGWTYRIPEVICAALSYRSPADRAARLNSLRQLVIDAVALGVTADEDEGNAELMAGQYAAATFALDLVLGECVLSDAVLNSFGRDAAGEEAAFFDNLDYEPLWWLRPERTRTLLASFSAGGEFPALYGHSALPLADVEAALAQGTPDYPPVLEAFLARHRLISDAFQPGYNPFAFGSEHRQFRLRSDDGNGSITIAGYLDILPILGEERLIIAVRHRIESPDYGGLAAMITEPDRAPFEADHRILMFEAVTVDRAGQEIPLVHEGTSERGVLFFAAPFAGDFSDTTLHLSMRFVETRWEIDVPLWASALAFDLRRDQQAGGLQ